MHHSQAIAAQPSAEAKAKLHGHLGDVFRLSGQRHRSRDACSNALALQPAYADAYACLAEAYRGPDALERAEPLLRRASRLDPTASRPPLQLARLLRGHGQLNRSFHVVRRFHNAARAEVRRAREAYDVMLGTQSAYSRTVRASVTPEERTAVLQNMVRRATALPPAAALRGLRGRV